MRVLSDFKETVLFSGLLDTFRDNVPEMYRDMIFGHGMIYDQNGRTFTVNDTAQDKDTIKFSVIKNFIDGDMLIFNIFDQRTYWKIRLQFSQKP